MIRILRSHWSRELFLSLWFQSVFSRLRWLLFFPEYTSYGIHAEVYSRPGQELGNPLLAHGGAEDLQPPDDMADKLRERVDGFVQLEQGSRAVFVHTPRPGGNGGRLDHEVLRGLRC